MEVMATESLPPQRLDKSFLYLRNPGETPLGVSGSGGPFADPHLARMAAWNNLLQSQYAVSCLDTTHDPNPNTYWEDAGSFELTDIEFSVTPDPATYGGAFDVVTLGPDQNGEYTVIITATIAPAANGLTILKEDYKYSDE